MRGRSSFSLTFLVSGITVGLLWLAMFYGGGFWPLLSVACVPFFVYIFKTDQKQALLCALFTGLGHFLLQLYWIVFVLGHYGGLPLYLSVPALLLLALYMAGYVLLFVPVARLFVRCFSPTVCLLLLPALWVGLDSLRSVLFSGFPWMDLGYGLAEVPLLYQSADIWGIAGLSFLVLLVNSFFALCFTRGASWGSRFRLAFPLCLICLVTGFYSGWRWQDMDSRVRNADSISVGIVQGNVDQGQKWSASRLGRTVQDYVKQSRKLMMLQGSLRPDLLVWPETSMPFFPVNHPFLPPVERMLQTEKVMLLAGAPWVERDTGKAGKPRYYNSAVFFDENGTVVGRSSKSHLVPFGEYVPFKKYLPFIAPLVEAVGDFSRGEIHNPPACKTARIGVLICFESIFGDISRKWVDAGANLLVNITNDAWYGNSVAPYQTLAMTRLRAVETRRSIVRSANTGFSCFIDPMGRVSNLSPLFVNWEAAERVAVMEGRTLYVRGGYFFGPVCLLLSGLALLVSGILKKQN